MGEGNDKSTRVERASDREVVVTRTFNGPVRIVFAAWTTPELFMRWWAPKSLGVPMIACEMDVRAGGGYRVAFGHDEASAMSFFGRYLEVVPNERLVWTNEESEDAGVTTVTFEEKGGKTLLVMRELYASKAAADEASGGMAPEQFAQLDELLEAVGAGRLS
ncbi:MAG: SRPBCC family protein [Proteobacteria bacterium]|nr:SRPBCC family protein [Pseudomonadota bacterium]